MGPDAGPVRDTDWDGVRLHIVTGKGGTGKTTVAAALALALAAEGRRVLLAEVEGRQGISQTFDVAPLAATGLATSGTVRPSLASRSSTADTAYAFSRLR